MNKLFYLSVTFLFLSLHVKSQTGDAIVGKWQSAHGTAQVDIVKRGDFYFGKISWMKEPNDESGKPKLDIHNPSKEYQTKPLVGLEIFKSFQFKGNNVWGAGKIYDPKTGNTYNGQMNLPENDKLNIRAFFGLSVLGRTETWTRINPD